MSDLFWKKILSCPFSTSRLSHFGSIMLSFISSIPTSVFVGVSSLSFVLSSEESCSSLIFTFPTSVLTSSMSCSSSAISVISPIVLISPSSPETSYSIVFPPLTVIPGGVTIVIVPVLFTIFCEAKLT